MRKALSLHHTADIINLLTAAQAMVDAVGAGIFTSATDDQDGRAAVITDNLDDCIRTVMDNMSDVGSPFLRYRREILGHYSTARRLQDLTLHLWNENNPIRMYSLFGNADERHTRIALELITSYVANGERDNAFMLMADEIRDMRRAEAEAEAVEAAHA